MPEWKPPNLPHMPKLPDWIHLPRFGERLRDHRTLRGTSIEQLAAAANIAPAALREIEAGTRSAPSPDIIRALAAALQLGKSDTSDLIDAAELDIPVVNKVLGRDQPQTQARPPLTAAILVFLIADIRGYTHFTQEFGDEAAAQLTAGFAELARGAAERGEGQVVETRGDEVLAVFPSAQKAVLAAHDIQARYAAELQTRPELPPGIGIGLDLGEAVALDEGYRGAVLNRAARLCSLAGPGEVLVSPGVAYVAPRVEGVTYIARGQQQLKGFEGPLPILLAAPRPSLVEGQARADPRAADVSVTPAAPDPTEAPVSADERATESADDAATS